MSEKILILGNGQIGNFYKQYFEQQNINVHLDTQVDIVDKKSVEDSVDDYKPTVIINTAGKTNLEWCEENRLEAFNINVLGADNIASVAEEKRIYFVHLSSGCIFESKDENDWKTEEATPAPASYYSFTKVWSEDMVKFGRSENFQYLILRPRQPVSGEVSNRNLLIKLLTFTKFVDTPNTGTVLEDLMVWTHELIKQKYKGTVNVSNEGWSTPYRIAQMLKKHLLPELPIEKISKQELDELVPNKRVDTILNVDLLKSLVSEVKTYEDKLEDIIIALKTKFKQEDKEFLRTELEKTIEQSKQRTVVNDVWPNLLELDK